MKNLNIKTVVIGIVVIGVIYYFFFYTPKEAIEDTLPAQATPNPSNSSYTPAPTSGGGTSINYTRVMERGDKGATVGHIQKALNRVLSVKGKTTLSIDEDFGGLTEGAMRYVMNRKTASYNQVKATVIAKYAAMGKSNPYTSGSGSSSQTNTASQTSENLSIGNVVETGIYTLNTPFYNGLVALGFI